MKEAKEWITYSGSASIYMLAADDSHFNDAVIASGRRIREPLLARDHHSLVSSKKYLLYSVLCWAITRSRSKDSLHKLRYLRSSKRPAAGIAM